MTGDLDPIEASLKRSFTPPALDALEAEVDAAATKMPVQADEASRPGGARIFHVPRAVWVGLGFAAAAAAVWLIVRSPVDVSPRPATEPPADPRLVARREAGAHLAGFVASGTPLPPPDGASCAGPEPPPADCESAAPVPWLAPSDRLAVLGECGAPGQAPCIDSGLNAARAVRLRLRPGGHDLFVCMEPHNKDPQPLLPNDAGLRLFRRELGPFVLYEITPLERPNALEQFSL